MKGAGCFGEERSVDTDVILLPEFGLADSSLVSVPAVHGVQVLQGQLVAVLSQSADGPLISNVVLR